MFWRRRSGANPMVRNAVAPSREARRATDLLHRRTKEGLAGVRGRAPQVPSSLEKCIKRRPPTLARGVLTSAPSEPQPPIPRDGEIVMGSEAPERSAGSKKRHPQEGQHSADA